MNRKNRADYSRRAPATQAKRPPPPPPAAPARVYECEADVLEGLEPFAQAELRDRFGWRVRIASDNGPGKLRFSYTGELPELLTLRSVVAVYFVLDFAVPRPKALLGNQQLGELTNAINAARALAPAGAFSSLRLSAAGEDSAILTRLKTELSQRLGLTIAAEEGDLLLRLRRAPHGEGWEMLVRITPRPLSTRAWRVCNWPGALNATLAYAMIQLTAPTPEDVVLNMACGSGTLLIERLMSSPARQVIGCDIDEEAIECARTNLRAAGHNRLVRLEQWDAGELPLPDASVSVLCADLPFGQLSGTHRENEALYPRVLAEAARVAQPGARMVLLTHEVRLLERVAERYAEQWELKEVLRVRSGGMTPAAALFQRKLKMKN